MKWLMYVSIILTIYAITAFEWPKMNANMKQEKRAFVGFLVAGAILSVLLVNNSKLPGPTQFFNTVYKPLITIVENWKIEGCGCTK